MKIQIDEKRFRLWFVLQMILAFCLAPLMSHAQTLIDFTGAPGYPARVDTYSNHFAGITLSSGDQWFSDAVNSSYFQNVNGTVLSTFGGSALTITFDAPAENVRLDFGSGSTLSGVTAQVVGYYDGQPVFTNYFATVKVAAGGWEVRGQTAGVVDQIAINRSSGSTTVLIDNLYFTTITDVVTVTANPANIAVCADNTVSFSASATSSTTPAVQWQVSVSGGPFTNIPDATNTIYSFTATAADGGNQYRAFFSDGTTSATSSAATLTVITSLPTPTIENNWDFVCPGSTGNEATAYLGDMGSGSAQGENGTSEGASKAFDGKASTKWLDFATAYPTTRASWIQYQYANGARFAVAEYSLTSANDAQERDPSDWQLLGSNDGSSWTTLDVRTNETFVARQYKRTFTFTNSTAYNVYRLQIDRVYNPMNANSVQLAELDLVEGFSGTYNYSWAITNGTITSGANLETVNYTAGAIGDVGLTLIISAGSGCSASQSINVPIEIPDPPTITLTQTNVCPGSAGNQASVSIEEAEVNWTISNGTITSGANSETVTYTAGSSGAVTLSVSYDYEGGCPSTGSVEVPINPLPTTAITLSPETVSANSAGNLASAPAGATTYAWSILNGTITSATNTQTITYTAGSSGTVGLTLIAGNSSGCTVSASTEVTINGVVVNIGSRVNSWLTNYAGKYARVYTTDAMKTAGNSVITWSNGTQNQTNPAYCGIQEIYSSTNWIYIRTTGVGSHVMGPWYLNAAHTQIFPNMPLNKKALYRFPVSPTVPATNTLTALGVAGYFVDGVAMFDSRDGFVWTGLAESGSGVGYWNRDAYVNESVTFDPGYAHQEQTGTHHYHANPIALRYLLGDHVSFNTATKVYSESAGAVTKHSPILGWVRDGYPIYGPYGYSNATDTNSGLRRMVSGFQLRNGQYGSDNLTTTGRNNIPAWAGRMYGISTNQTGPAVSTAFPLGRYMEDNVYLGDLGRVQGIDFDLDEYNGRFCVTPEFPRGTYAYFVSIEVNGTPKFPYNLGRAYRGNPIGSAVTAIMEPVTTNFLGAVTAPLRLNQPQMQSSTVTLRWNAIEGGTYQIDSSTNLPNWNVLASNISANQTNGAYTNVISSDKRFYRASRTGLATFDNAGTTLFATASVAPGGSATRGTTVIVTITLPTTPAQPPANSIPTSVTLGGTIYGTNLSRPSQGTVQVTFVIPGGASTGAKDIVVTFSPGPTYTLAGGFTIN